MTPHIECMRIPCYAGLILFLAAGATQAQNPIQDRINTALAAKAAEVIIPPGSYRVSTGLRFNGIKNFTVRAAGVSMVCAHTGGSLSFDRCENVEVAGLTVDYDPLPFTQGTIIAAAADWSSIDVRIHAGYRTDKPNATRLEIYDQKTRLLKPDVWMLSGEAITAVSPGVWRWAGTGGFKGKVALGDFAVDAYDGSMSITIGNCVGITLRDFTHHSSYSYGVLESHSSGSRFLNYRLALGPIPSGGDQPRLRTSNYDGMHFIDDRLGPHIENCLIENLGDDAIAIHGVFGKLTGAVDGGRSVNVISVSGGDGNFGADAGDTLFFMNPDYGFNGQAVATASNGGNYSLDRDMTVASGGLVYNANRIGSGYVIKGCTIRNKRARGILARGSNGLIENNLIDWTQQAGIALFPEYGQWYQSGWARNVKIRGNTLLRCLSFGTTPAVTITGGDKSPPAGLFRDIEISGNTFDSCTGVNLAVGSVTGLVVSGNVFRNPVLGGNSVVTLRDAADVTLSRNCLAPMGTKKPLTWSAVENLTGGEDGIGAVCASGIRASAEPVEPGTGARFMASRSGEFTFDLGAGAWSVRAYDPVGRLRGTVFHGAWGGGVLRRRGGLPAGDYVLKVTQGL